MTEIKKLFTDVVKNAVKLGAIGFAAALLVFGVNADAQVSGQVRGLGTAGTTNLLCIPPLTTNTYWTFPNQTNGSPQVTNTFSSPGALLSANTNLLDWKVADFDYIGVTFGFNGTATSTNSFQWYASYDGGVTFSPIAFLNFTNLTPGAASWYTNFVADVHGITDLAARFYSSGSTPATNVLFELVAKANKVQTRAATY